MTYATARACMLHELTRIHGGTPARADRRSAQTAGWEAGSTRGFASPKLPADHAHVRYGTTLSIANHPVGASGRSNGLKIRNHAASRDEFPFAHRTLFTFSTIVWYHAHWRNGSTAPTFERQGLSGCHGRRDARRVHAPILGSGQMVCRTVLDHRARVSDPWPSPKKPSLANSTDL